MTNGMKTSEFWTHIAVSTAALGSTLGTVFDKGFTGSHPALAAGITFGGLMCAAISQAAYSISRGLAKQGSAPTEDPGASPLAG